MIIFPAIIILIVIFIFFAAAFLRSNEKVISEGKIENYSLKLSVIVALKNEAGNIPALLNSIKQLDYPEEYFEVILVDDNSTDSTFALINEAAKNCGNIYAYKAEDKSMPGKKGVLAFGIQKTSNPYILITDADCKPNAGWLKTASGKFSQGYDLIFGIAPFIKENFLINKISCFENLRSSILTFGLSGLNIFYSAAARNFGFKKDSFEMIKGYANTNETLSGDDDLLIREAVKNNLRIGMLTAENSFVFSSTKKTFKKYFKQKSRHTKTSLYYSTQIKLLLGAWHLLNLLFLFSIIPAFYNWIFIFSFLVKIGTDIFLTKRLQKFYGYNFNAGQIILLQILYEIFLIINFINAAISKDEWK